MQIIDMVNRVDQSIPSAKLFIMVFDSNLQNAEHLFQRKLNKGYLKNCRLFIVTGQHAGQLEDQIDFLLESYSVTENDKGYLLPTIAVQETEEILDLIQSWYSDLEKDIVLVSEDKALKLTVRAVREIGDD